MTLKDRRVANGSRRKVRSRVNLARGVTAIVAGLILALISSFSYFLIQIEASERAKPPKSDAIVAFSGDPKRIVVALDLLVKGFASQLIIVGQDNSDKVAEIRSTNGALFDCCVKVDSRSENTAEDAILAKWLLKASGARSIILVTSSFHVPRARREMQMQVPEIDIAPFGVSDDFYRLGDILNSPKVGSAFLSQYALYLSSWIPRSRHVIEKSKAHAILRAVTDLQNIALALVAVGAALLAGYALLRHRNRHR